MMHDSIAPNPNEFDIETLMARVRERVAQRREMAGRDEAPSHSDQAYSDLARALSGQADFNRSIVATLADLSTQVGSIYHHLSSLREQVDADARRGAERAMEVRQELKTELSPVSTRIEGLALRMDELSARLSAQGDAMDRELAELRAETQAQRTALQEELRAAISEMQEQWGARAAELEARLQRTVGESTQPVEQLKEQVERTSALLESFDARVARVEEQVSDHATRLAQDQDTLLQQVEERLAALNDQVQASGEQISLVNEQIPAQVAQLTNGVNELRATAEAAAGDDNRLREELDHKLEELRVRLLRAERHLRDRDLASPPGRATAASPTSSVPEEEVAGSRSDLTSGASLAQPFDYFLFEHQFRGSTADIKRRQEQYLPIFLDCDHVLDLGSGRGEFLELLSDHGISATGVDLDEDMVALCEDRGLRVVHADLFAYLEQLPNATLGGIASFQVVEHLTPQEILRLIALCGAKLRPGAPIVFETVNPICPVAMGNFYLDPTHVRPVPSQMLRYMFEQGPFTVQRVLFSAPVAGAEVESVLDLTDSFPPEVVHYQDYAVVAKRR
jgi:SAM-dependent methyltransferase